MFHTRSSSALVAALMLVGCSDFFLSRRQPEVADPLTVTETFEQAPLPRLDLLWVIDDTPSMSDEHDALAAAMPAFADALQEAGVAWQVGVVTTDPGEDLGVLRGDPWILTPSEAESLDLLLDTAAITLLGREPASGIAAMVLALESPLRTDENRGFRRPDAALEVIVVSDGDDRSDAVLGPDAIDIGLSTLEAEADSTGRPARLSAVVGPRGGCSGPGGSALPGLRYLELAEATGGTTASICEGHMESVIADLGASSVEWQTEFPLQATPETGSLRVAIDGLRADTGWSMATGPDRVVFDLAPAPGAVITVRYTVADR